MFRREYTHTQRLLSLVLMLGCLISSLAISHRSANARIETSNNTLPGEQPAAALHLVAHRHQQSRRQEQRPGEKI